MIGHTGIGTAAALGILAASAGCGPGAEDALVGSWRLDSGALGEEVYAFRGDGTVSLRDRDGEVMAGLFEVDDGLLIVEAVSDDGDEFELEATYYVNGDRLLLGAATPDGEVLGLVGAWRARLDARAFHAASQRQETRAFETELVFRDDGTVSFTAREDGALRSGEGAYEPVAGAVRISADGSALELPFVDGRAIGGLAGAAVE